MEENGRVRECEKRKTAPMYEKEKNIMSSEDKWMMFGLCTG